MSTRYGPSIMRVTSVDIAKEVGLSQPTVSRILNGVANHRASEETRRRVIEIAQAMGYYPNAVARALKSRRTGIFGFYTDYTEIGLNEPQIASIVGMLQRGCAKHQIDILLVHNNPCDCPKTVFHKLTDGRMDGLFLHIKIENPIVEHLAHSPIPLIAVSVEVPGVFSVVYAEGDVVKTIASLLET